MPHQQISQILFARDKKHSSLINCLSISDNEKKGFLLLMFIGEKQRLGLKQGVLGINRSRIESFAKIYIFFSILFISLKSQQLILKVIKDSSPGASGGWSRTLKRIVVLPLRYRSQPCFLNVSCQFLKNKIFIHILTKV